MCNTKCKNAKFKRKFTFNLASIIMVRGCVSKYIQRVPNIHDYGLNIRQTSSVQHIHNNYSVSISQPRHNTIHNSPFEYKLINMGRFLLLLLLLIQHHENQLRIIYLIHMYVIGTFYFNFYEYLCSIFLHNNWEKYVFFFQYFLYIDGHVFYFM